MGNEWDWNLADRARRELERLDSYAQERIIDKLDDIVTDQWREPPDFLEPLQGAPHQKLRIGQFRLGCRVDRDRHILFVLRIKTRGSDAYRGDD